MMNSYQVGPSTTHSSPSKTELKPPLAKKITESPYYSAHATNQKFFKTIDESPILGARGSTPKNAPAPGNKFRSGSMWETQDFRNSAHGSSAIHLRN